MLPCADIDEIEDFSTALGFRTAQTRTWPPEEVADDSGRNAAVSVDRHERHTTVAPRTRRSGFERLRMADC